MKKHLSEITHEKPKQGRPKSTNPKLDGIHVRLTSDELTSIKEAIGQQRISEWVRLALLKAAKRTLTARR
jgi:hypothetical protein